MPQAGGSATMYGVLYQLLGTAHWATKIQLSATTEDSTWTEAQLVIEPAEGGGDTCIESPQRRIVEQWKAKSDEGAWSLRKVIADVLPDLYRAVDLADESHETEFRFVTEGHRGRWDAAESFFADLSGNEVPDDPYAALNDEDLVNFFRDGELTKLAFFRSIVRSLRTHPDIRQDSEIESAKKLWYLLGRFAIHGDLSTEKLVHELDGFLRPLVDYSEQVEPKRRELCAALLELAASGSATFTPQELLAKVNLYNKSFHDWANARSAILSEVTRKLEKHWRYRHEIDVRSPPQIQSNSHICVLNGESGQGKTWRLASLALETFARGSLALAITATGDADRDLQNAANIAWRAGFEREGPTDIELVAKKRRDFLPRLPTPWLTICIDDVKSMTEVRSLIERDWSAMDIRLVFTSLPPVTQALRTQYGQEIEVVDTSDFSVMELRRYLETDGHDWGMIPDDVRTILRRPLLAKLYCDLAEDDIWRNTDEYALFARYWQRIRDDRNQVDHPGDVEAMRKLASTFLGADVIYPWTQAECAQCGLSSDGLIRLESVGWLRRVDGDRVEVAHDRLLNWAIAETIVAKRVAGECSVDEVAELVSEFFGGQSASIAGQMLGYVPMDVCWLMSDPKRGLTHELPKVIAALENETAIWYSEPLYRNLLPTLGPRIIGPMIDRVRLVGDENETTDEPGPFANYLSKAIVQIGDQYPEAAAESGDRMLQDECSAVRWAGLRVLKRFPDVKALDRLWDLHRVNFDVYKRKEGQHYWFGHSESFAALKSCVQLDVEWLKRRVLESDTDDQYVTELAYLVANIEGVRGRELWMHVKRDLFARVSADEPRCLATCIQAHNDISELPRLEAWLTEENDLCSQVAFAGIVHLDPKRALGLLPRLDPQRLYVTRSWWLPGLLLQFPEETRRAITKIIRDSPTGRWRTALVYQDDPNQMDDATLALLLDELVTLIQNATDSGNEAQTQRLYGPLGLLADLTRLDLLSQFEARAGTLLEESLTELACSWVGRMNEWADHELNGAIKVLVKVGGAGITRLVNEHLRSSNKHARLHGIDLSLIRPDTDTRQLLANITQTSVPWDQNESFPLLQAKATVALAALGENRAVAMSILRWGKVLRELPDMRLQQPPMTDEDLAEVIQALENADESNRTHAVRALGVSGRVDFAPLVRQALKTAEPESELAKATVIALDHFGDTHPETINLLKAQLDISSHAHAASLALLGNGMKESLAILEEQLRRHGFSSGLAESDILAVNLGRRRETRKTVGEVLWDDIKRSGRRLGMLRPLDCLAEINSPEILEFLIQQAHAPEQQIHVVGEKAGAIRALAKINPDSAFRAAETALRMDRKDLEFYPDALVEIDEARAVAILLEVYSAEQPTLAQWAIGRALRRIFDRTSVHSRLDEMMDVRLPEIRIKAVELTGWQPPTTNSSSRLRQIAITDPVRSVRRAAEQAVQSTERQETAFQLLRAISEAHGSRSWSYLEAIVRVCDPWLLTTKNDSLSIWPSLSNKPPALRHHASNLIKKRKEDLEKEAKWMDRNKER